MRPYDVRFLPEEGEHIEEALPPEWIHTHVNDDLPQEELALTATEAAHASIDLNRIHSPESEGIVVRVKGRVTAKLATHCVRCLAEVPLSVDGTIDLTLFPAENAGGVETPGADEEVIEAPEEGTYKDFTIDLPEIVREAILLEVDMNPSCADEAACADRLAHLLEEVGAAPSREPDPRWAALARLKDSVDGKHG